MNTEERGRGLYTGTRLTISRKRQLNSLYPQNNNAVMLRIIQVSPRFLDLHIPKYRPIKSLKTVLTAILEYVSINFTSEVKMIFTLSWLKEYVEFDMSPEELAHSLTMGGLEVEAVEYRGKGLDNIVVAQILETRPHPGADKLQLCLVTDGERSYDIVCGATNMKAGDKVALAKIGAHLPPGPKFPEGLKIKKAKIRGEVSEGMLCAENEIGIGQESEGIMILPDTAKIGSRLVEELGLDDVVFEIGITPNRPDCLSLTGVAREVAVLSGTTVKYPDLSVQESGDEIAGLAKVELLDSDKCPRYSCRVIRGVTIAPSPQWLKTKLESSGIRSINNVVDVTNYVLLELGQPLHAFDYNLLSGHKIIVRAAERGETIETLDGIERKLTEEDLLICDAEKPVALAGIMGGATTEVSEGTTDILLESAYFNPVTVRQTSRSTGLRSESSYRFERGVDPNGIVDALDRASELIRELAGGEVAKGRIDEYPNPIEPCEVRLSIERMNKMLGTDIDEKEITRLMNWLGLGHRKTKAGEMLFLVPTYRVDITREIDLIEEIARLYGYNNIPTTLPSVTMKTEINDSGKKVKQKFKSILVSRGYYEVINYSFDDPEALAHFDNNEALSILNPLTNESSAMRTSLLPGIIRNAVLNLNHQAQELKLFEIGKAYFPEGAGNLPKEVNKIAGAAAGRRGVEYWEKDEVDFFDLKSVLESAFDSLSITKYTKFESTHSYGFLHPGKSAAITVDGKDAGYIGEIHPELRDRLGVSKRLYVFEISLDIISSASQAHKPTFTPLPKFPSVRRDIALIVDSETPVSSVLDEIEKSGSNLIEDAQVFDVFTGNPVEEGKKSIAVSLQMRAADKTLTEEEINKAQEKTVRNLELALGAQLRTI